MDFGKVKNRLNGCNPVANMRWIDSAKGIGMLTVICGHWVTLPGKLRVIIYLFHMPLFFVLSGMLAKNATNTTIFQYSSRRALRLLVPYFVISFIVGTLWIIFASIDPGVFRQAGDLPSIIRFVSAVLAVDRESGYLLGIGPMWYLVALFVSEIYVFCLFKFLGSNRALLAACLLIFGAIGIYLKQRYKFQFWWCLDSVMISALFFGIGFALRDRVMNAPASWVGMVLGAVILMTSTVLSYRYFGIVNTDMYMGVYPSMFLFFSGSIGGISLLVNLVKNISLGPQVEFIGKNSLVYLALHGSMIPALAYLLPRRLIVVHSSVEGALVTLFAVTIISVAMVPFVKLINTYVPWMVGRR